jgi:hypothetical protein
MSGKEVQLPCKQKTYKQQENKDESIILKSHNGIVCDYVPSVTGRNSHYSMVVRASNKPGGNGNPGLSARHARWECAGHAVLETFREHR